MALQKAEPFYIERIDKMNAPVSVIVPVYNVKKYLQKCLDSLLCQTLKDIEILVIDDG